MRLFHSRLNLSDSLSRHFILCLNGLQRFLYPLNLFRYPLGIAFERFELLDLVLLGAGGQLGCDLAGGFEEFIEFGGEGLSFGGKEFALCEDGLGICIKDRGLAA